MSIIGRRLILDWGLGSKVIAIEKLIGTAAEHGIPSGSSSMLQDIYGNPWSSDVYFVNLESDTASYGHTVNHYMQTQEAWLTLKERRQNGF